MGATWRRAFSCLAFVLTPILFGSVNGTPSLQGVFTGTIGTSEVVVELGISPHLVAPLSANASVTGEYFYRRYGRAIMLVGSPEADGSWFLREVTPSIGGQKLTGDTWHVRAEGKALTGLWSRPSQTRTLPIKLRVIGGVGAADRFSDATLYERELLRGSVTRSAPRESAYGGSYVILTDPRFEVSGVEITKLPNERSRLAANVALMTDFDRTRIAAANCLNTAYTGNGAFRQSFRVALFTGSTLTLDRRSIFFCGGVHPDEESDPLTVDLRDGTAIDWTHAIENRGSIAEIYLARGAAIWRERGFDPCIGLYDPKNPASEARPTLIKDNFSYEIVPTGLLVRVSFPHVIAGCEVDVVIPSAEAWSLLRPSYRSLLP